MVQLINSPLPLFFDQPISGVKMRNFNWTRKWLERGIARAMFPLPLGDQDAYTVMIYENPQIHYLLPSQWNIQTCIESRVIMHTDPGMLYMVHINGLGKSKSNWVKLMWLWSNKFDDHMLNICYPTVEIWRSSTPSLADFLRTRELQCIN